MTDPDPARDLTLTRDFDAPPEAVWRCWAEAELFCRWFVPPPWRCAEVALDLVPGGRFFTRMAGPAGEDMASEGAVLAVDPGRSISWTDALTAGWRPAGGGFMTATVTLTPRGGGTRYDVLVRHATPEACASHEEMGFSQGWGTAADQLGALAAGL